MPTKQQTSGIHSQSCYFVMFIVLNTNHAAMSGINTMVDLQCRCLQDYLCWRAQQAADFLGLCSLALLTNHATATSIDMMFSLQY